MEVRATLLNHIPACRSELKLLIMTSFSIVETVKKALAVCGSFLFGEIQSRAKIGASEPIECYCKKHQFISKNKSSGIFIAINFTQSM